MLPRLWVIRLDTTSQARLEPTQFPSTGTTSRKAGRRADHLFDEPGHSPENRHARRPSQVIVATAHTVSGTPFKGYKPLMDHCPPPETTAQVAVRNLLATEVTKGHENPTLVGRNQVIYCLNEQSNVKVPPRVCDLRRLKAREISD